jgi:chorismate-pyruvate lyase
MEMDRSPTADLEALLALFYRDPAEFGTWEAVEADAMPEPYRRLLAHDQHMTVTVEAFHGSLVDVQVLAVRTDPPNYARQILLRRQSDGRVVQFGIVRLNLQYLSPDVRAQIERQEAPLGRILIEHGVLREIRLQALWRIEPASPLAAWLEAPPNTATYGRTAVIECDGEPAIELLEVVAPIEAFAEPRDAPQRPA